MSNSPNDLDLDRASTAFAVLGPKWAVTRAAIADNLQATPFICAASLTALQKLFPGGLCAICGREHVFFWKLMYEFFLPGKAGQRTNESDFQAWMNGFQRAIDKQDGPGKGIWTEFEILADVKDSSVTLVLALTTNMRYLLDIHECLEVAYIDMGGNVPTTRLEREVFDADIELRRLCESAAVNLETGFASQPLDSEFGNSKPENSSNFGEGIFDNEPSPNPEMIAHIEGTLAERARIISPFNLLDESESTDLLSHTEWATYSSSVYGFSVLHPVDWSFHLENVALQEIPFPWIDAVVLSKGTPPHALAFHVSLRQVGVLDGFVNRSDGSTVSVSSYDDLPPILRESALTEFHSSTLLDERNIEVAGLKGHLLTYRHFGLKIMTAPLDSPIWEHSCLLYGHGIAYNIIIECPEADCEEHQQVLQLMLTNLQLPFSNEQRNSDDVSEKESVVCAKCDRPFKRIDYWGELKWGCEKCKRVFCHECSGMDYGGDQQAGLQSHNIGWAKAKCPECDDAGHAVQSIAEAGTTTQDIVEATLVEDEVEEFLRLAGTTRVERFPGGTVPTPSAEALKPRPETGQARCDVSQPSDNPFGTPNHGGQMQAMPTAPTEGDATGGVIPYNNMPALLAYYLGLFSLLPCFGLFLAVPARILGIKGLRKRKQNPTVKGSAHAWFGVVMGTIFTLVWGAVWILMIIGMIVEASNV